MSEQVKELRGLGARIEEWRLGRGLSKNTICARFGQLGSTKTFGRILDEGDDLEGMDIAKQLENYRAAWELVHLHKEDPEERRIYGDFDFMRAAMVTVGEALEVPDITRLVLITAGPGGGKSTFLDLLEQSQPMANITYRVEATEAWRESTNELMGALLREIGVFERAPVEGERRRRDSERALPVGAAGRLRKIVERLNGRKVILAIDEGHHIGPAGYNIVKTIINQTRAVVVMAAIPDLILRINRNSHVEAAQLFYNRLFKHIRFSGPSSGDALEFMKRRGVKFESADVESRAAERVVEASTTMGLWKFVVRCAREGRQSQRPHGDKEFAGVIAKVKSNISLGG